MEKAYRIITWHNGGQPPISAENLQAISDGLNLVDDRVIELDKDKLEAKTESPELGDVIKWDGSRWVNGPAPGGGGEGTSDYQDLSHKPSINGVTLAGDVSGEDLGFVDSEVTDEIKAGLTAGDGLMFRFAEDGEGNHGYLAADGSFIPFKSGGAGGDAVFVPMYIVNGSARTTDVYTNNSGKDVTIYYCVRSGASGSGSSPYAKINVDGATIVSLTSLTTLYEGSVSVPNGSKLQVYTNTNIYFIGSFSSLPFEKNVPIEDHVPSKEGAIIEPIYSASVKQSTGLTFTPDDDIRAFTICDANIVYAFATTDMATKRLYNSNGIISLTKNADKSFTLKWTSQYTGTVALTVFGIK